MPIRKREGETKDEFVSRCIAIEINSGKASDQAAAICYNYWEEKQLSSVKRIRKNSLKSNVPHYTADGILWTGATHEHNGRLMTGATHTDDSEYLYHKNELQKFESYNDYPEAAKENAKIALRWAEKNGWGDCGTPVGKQRANQLANGENISEDTISRMAGFERHRQNSQKELGDGCGRLMWLAWGGDEGIAWAQKKLKQIRGENFEMHFEKTRVYVESSNADRVMWNSDSLELTISFLDGSIYTYYEVSEEVFNKIVDGDWRPKTTDSQNPPRWVEGRKPSVGAAIHHYLIEKNVAFNKGGSFR